VLVKNDKLKRAILTALADEEMMHILNSAMHIPKSVFDIIRETSIPHTTTYRKVKWLVENDLLIVDKIVISPDGKKTSLFRSVLNSITVRYENNSIVVEAKQSFDVMEKTVKHFLSL